MSAPCRWCGLIHGPMCPAVKALEFYPDGAIKRVEFKTGSDNVTSPAPVLPFPRPPEPLKWHISGANRPSFMTDDATFNFGPLNDQAHTPGQALPTSR